MRRYLDINLGDQSIETQQLEGAECIRAGRHLIAKTLLERGLAEIDPLSP